MTVVTALPKHQRILLDLQETDNALARVRRAIGDLERDSRADALHGQIAALSPQLIEITGAIEDATAEIRRIESDVQLVDQRLEQDSARIDSSSNPRDIMGLEHEVITLRARKSALEDAELEAMENRESLQIQLDAISAERAEIASALASLDSVIAAERASLMEETQSLAGTRDSIVASIPSDLYELYEKQRTRYGVGAALLQRGVSGGSGMALSAHDLEVIRKTPDNDIVMCPDSNCILVRTEESGLS
jgi:predicted  nucleic acid-binding Zn-ribbon protein